MSRFSEEDKKRLLKFVTSCSRPPLLGFKVRMYMFKGQEEGGMGGLCMHGIEDHVSDMQCVVRVPYLLY